ncbi:MAG: UDP-glucose 4-epimerase, partial [Gammaproteobacteria bacterium]
NLSNGDSDSLSEKCELVVGDVVNSDLVRECFKGIDGCFHLAAAISAKGITGNWIDSHRTNLIGSINILDAASLNKTPVVYASSSAVYGDNAGLLLKEQDRLRPLTAYGADKLSSELHARVAATVHGLPTTGLRFFNVYGPGQNSALPNSSVITVFIDRLLRGKAVNIHGDGEQIRDFIYVGDAVRFLRKAMYSSRPGSAIYNVCTGESVSINQLARSIMSILNINLPTVHQPTRKGDIRGFVGDPSLAGRYLGVSTRYRLAERLYHLIKHEQEMNSAINPAAIQVRASSQVCFLR